MLRLFPIIGFVCLIFVSCQTLNLKDLTPTTPTSIYFNKAQTLTDRGKTKDALFVYNKLLQKPNLSKQSYLEAHYEIAFLAYKQKKWSLAFQLFSKLKQDYQIYITSLPDNDPKLQNIKWIGVLSAALLNGTYSHLNSTQKKELLKKNEMEKSISHSSQTQKKLPQTHKEIKKQDKSKT